MYKIKKLVFKKLLCIFIRLYIYAQYGIKKMRYNPYK